MGRGQRFGRTGAGGEEEVLGANYVDALMGKLKCRRIVASQSQNVLRSDRASQSTSLKIPTSLLSKHPRWPYSRVLDSVASLPTDGTVE